MLLQPKDLSNFTKIFKSEASVNSNIEGKTRCIKIPEVLSFSNLRRGSLEFKTIHHYVMKV